jgi:serine/threonine-protein kinase
MTTYDEQIIGTQLANFSVERLLGRGGMARVYYGHDVKLDRPVAIKVVDTRYWGEEDYARRFVEEAKLIATWRHENIIQVYYANDENGLYYFVMEYVDGHDLADILAERLDLGQLLPHDEVRRIGWAIARGLDYAHKKGVVHRDIKPSNVLVATDGRVVLSDFGLALDQKRGSQGQAFGTPHYISPEQARRSSDAVPASDIYSFAIILYEMLTGVIPFDDPSSTAIALKHLSDPPPLPSSINPRLNAATDAVLLNALSKQPEERYGSAMELMKALENALQRPQDGAAGADLPLPPVVGATNPSKPSTRRISLAERSAQWAAERAPLDTTIPGNQLRRQEKRKRWQGLLLLLLLALLIVLGVWYISNLGGLPMVLAAFSPLNATATASPSALPLPSDTAAPTLTNTITPVVVPTYTPTPEVTNRMEAMTEITTTATTKASMQPTKQLPASKTAKPTKNNPAATKTIASPTISPSATATFSTTAIVPLTTQSTLITETITATPALEITPSTSTPTPEGTVTPTETPTLAISALPSPTPTSYFVLYYDYNSFYMLNKSGAPVEYLPFAFERLDQYGMAINRFDGKEWARYAQLLPDKWCSRLEILQAEPYLQPWQCFDLYGATRNPPRTSEWIFWTKKSGSSEFRVLWDNEEVGRCTIADGTCEFWLPQP